MSKPPVAFSRAVPFVISLLRESRTVEETESAAPASAPTSPPRPAPTRRIQPLTLTSSPGRYIFRSSKTYQRSSSCASRLTQPVSLPHQSARSGRKAVSPPFLAMSSPTPASDFGGSSRRTSPSAPLDACAPESFNVISTPSSDCPSLSDVAQPTNSSRSTKASRPMLVTCTHVRRISRSCCLTPGSTTTKTLPRPFLSAGARSMRVSVISSGWPDRARRCCFLSASAAWSASAAASRRSSR